MLTTFTPYSHISHMWFLISHFKKIPKFEFLSRINSMCAPRKSTKHSKIWLFFVPYVNFCSQNKIDVWLYKAGKHVRYIYIISNNKYTYISKYLSYILCNTNRIINYMHYVYSISTFCRRQNSPSLNPELPHLKQKPPTLNP